MVGPLRAWDAETALKGDSAAPGVTAWHEVAKRALRTEVGLAQVLVSAQLLWDIDAFYDSMTAKQATRRMDDLKAPRAPTTLALIMQKAQRWLRYVDSLAPPVFLTGRSIVAGCTSSTSLARWYLHKAAAAAEGSGATAHQHVDDLTHLVIANSEAMVADI